MNAEQQMRINDFLVNVFNQILAWEGQTIKKVGVKNLSIRELHVIQAVSDATKLGQNTMANIAKLLAVSPGALSISVNGLVNKGYLEREYTSKDRRVIYIKLNGGKNMRAVITVKGKDGVGIIAEVSRLMADSDINIVDISQTTISDNFFMVMLVDIKNSKKDYSEIATELKDLGKKLNQNINISNEKLFNSMHRI